MAVSQGLPTSAATSGAGRNVLLLAVTLLAAWFAYEQVIP
jgi:hypothetical protein